MEKQRRSAELDSEIADKEERAREIDREKFPDAVRKEVAKQTKALTEAKRTVELERDSAMAQVDALEVERDNALRQLREHKTGELQKTVGVWLCDYAKHLQPFDETQHRQTLNKVGDVAEGRYDWKIGRGRGCSL